MSDNELTAPKGAHLIGRAIVLLGWLLFLAAAGLIVVMIVVGGSVRPGGIVLALLIAGCGAAALALGHNIQDSRTGGRPLNRG